LFILLEITSMIRWINRDTCLKTQTQLSWNYLKNKV